MLQTEVPLWTLRNFVLPNSKIHFGSLYAKFRFALWIFHITCSNNDNSRSHRNDLVHYHLEQCSIDFCRLENLLKHLNSVAIFEVLSRPPKSCSLSPMLYTAKRKLLQAIEQPSSKTCQVKQRHMDWAFPIFVSVKPLKFKVPPRGRNGAIWVRLHPSGPPKQDVNCVWNLFFFQRPCARVCQFPFVRFSRFLSPLWSASPLTCEPPASHHVQSIRDPRNPWNLP